MCEFDVKPRYHPAGHGRLIERPAVNLLDKRRPPPRSSSGLVDTMHVAVSQVELGSGSRLWESPDELLDQFHLEVVPSPSGVTHYLFWRR